MAPDKIYLDKFGQSIEGYIPEGCSLVTEYLRKDALLEWAKVYKEEADASARGRTDNPSWGERVALTALVNFINSL